MLVLVLIRLGASRLPLSLLVLTMLPWLPMPVPAAMLLWTSPLVAVVWAGVLTAMAATVPWRPITLPAHPLPVRAALLALVIYSAAAWAVAPSRPGGDEPHYLIITQSLLRDHDLEIENNHARGDYREYFAGDLSKPDYLRRGRERGDLLDPRPGRVGAGGAGVSDWRVPRRRRVPAAACRRSPPASRSSWRGA